MIVLQTKGGVGKGFIAKEVLPFWFARDMLMGGEKESFPIRGYELENSNSSKERGDEYVTAEYIRFSDDSKTENVDEKKLLAALDKIAMGQKDIVSIVNFGGGSDTQSIINSIDKTLLDDFVFIVPFFSSFESITGAISTAQSLKASQLDLKVVLVANRLSGKIVSEDAASLLALAASEEEGLQKSLLKLGCPISYVPEFSTKDEMPILESMSKSIVAYFREIIDVEDPQERTFLKKIRDEAEAEFGMENFVDAFMEKSKKFRADVNVFRTLLKCRHLYETIKAQ